MCTVPPPVLEIKSHTHTQKFRPVFSKGRQKKQKKEKERKKRRKKEEEEEEEERLLPLKM